jgi:hypothetical protein
MSRAPKGRKNTSKGDKSHRGEARRFLGTTMQQAMIRGLGDDEARTRAWMGVANEMHQNDELGSGIVENIAIKVQEANE